ncbi:hypothetical protein RDABS01_034262, partial [Bienertia sinuspersici]
VQNGNKDRLSSLSDDILVSILQLIDMNDATRTSILSRRWRNLAPCSFFTIVDLDAKKTSLIDCKTRCISYNDVKPIFLNWAHKVVTSQRAPFINDFRVCFPLSHSDSNCLCTWIKFAMAKDNLTSLCLSFINISGELLELLLSHFHHLKRLYVEGSDDLLDLEIINSFEKLKYLAVHRCTFLRKVEIYAVKIQMNLLSFEFSHSQEDFVCDSMNVNVMHCFAVQLTKLSLHLDLMKLSIYGDPHLLSFPNVKYLELQVIIGHHPYDWSHLNLLRLRYYAEACPVLDNLKLQ